MTITARPHAGQPTVFLRRWDPFREMEDVYDRMGNLIQGYMADTGRATMIPVDIEETEDAYIVDVDLPDVKAEDVDIELRANELRITGEIKERERAGIVRRRERRVGRFEHVVVLPGDVDPDSVDATLHDGVLTVRLTKASANRPRHIDVKTA